MLKPKKILGGRGTYSNFDLVTAVTPKWLSEHVRMTFPNSAGSRVDYLSNYDHISQFKVSAGSLLIDGNSYSNKFISTNSQFIAPQDCYLKSVNGFISPRGGALCGEETITISIWKKSATIGGTTSTPMNLLFTQSFAFSGSSNNLVLEINGDIDSLMDIVIPAKEGVIVSVKRGVEEPCANIVASFEMVFELIDTQVTTEEFSLESLATNTVNNGSGRRLSSTLNTALV